MVGRYIIEGIGGNRPNELPIHQHIKNFIIICRHYIEVALLSASTNILPEGEILPPELEEDSIK
ncbi:hypothetical protein MTHERMMSTA1_16880 [Methanosarcina thermophila MST-A1]|uniref:Spore coat protein A n=1 Tax=Methanosarcina thermophila TaxID=2210 RepID=A0A3G9CSA2_METTE|nr:hypothetical protein [Methanosarcina thermophila]ALK05175.1 MAG: hypothetical protein AAY43_04985 [Methanosarcina sp. 795]NLU55993.1 hypothetical protein [Methanosarcina thermophila]BAW28975.1 spore coat protein A [Methanosarcina thermophila]GLI14562.1 hypothetical protein MTHERMMSTA1_16880 [Methanosarcina thermophila MST-A1]HOA68461.1 hypothetical protein [Methanosarcina thermophila]